MSKRKKKKSGKGRVGATSALHITVDSGGSAHLSRQASAWTNAAFQDLRKAQSNKLAIDQELADMDRTKSARKFRADMRAKEAEFEAVRKKQEQVAIAHQQATQAAIETKQAEWEKQRLEGVQKQQEDMARQQEEMERNRLTSLSSQADKQIEWAQQRAEQSAEMGLGIFAPYGSRRSPSGSRRSSHGRRAAN